MFYFSQDGNFKDIPGGDEFENILFRVSSLAEVAAHFGIDAESDTWKWLEERGPPHRELTHDLLRQIMRWQMPEASPRRTPGNPYKAAVPAAGSKPEDTADPAVAAGQNGEGGHSSRPQPRIL